MDDEKGKSKEDSQENKDYSEKPPSENEMLNVIEEKKKTNMKMTARI